MLAIDDKANCCGCGACAQKCPKQCITLAEDKEGFLYPSVDSGKCIECGVCESVCPFIHTNEARLPIKVLAAFDNDEQIRLASSSGGLFTSLASQVIKRGGVVFGAGFDSDWMVNIGYSETLDGLTAFRGSKYLQARVGNSFVECEQFLKSGREVLFSGSPCQIAGLNSFLQHDYEKLTTIDFVCHGAPSPKVWKLYLAEVVAAVNGHKKLSDCKFSFSQYNSDTVSIVSPFRCNDYMRAFLTDLILRPSCYNCKVRESRSMSDVTIGDYWGIQNVCPDMDDDKGTSLVLLHSSKGLELLKSADCLSVESSFDEAVASNSAIISSPSPSGSRDKFFSGIENSPSMIKLIGKSIETRTSIWKRLHSLAHLAKSRMKRKLRREKDIYRGEKMEPCNISFRSKGRGWKEYELRIDFKAVK